MSQEEVFRTFREGFAYYDRSGMQEFLEQKASEGWRLVRRHFASDWEFERIEPQKLHYAITYLPRFSNEDEFLASENKKEYLEICSASGWQFVCAYKNMAIFLNEEAEPLPFETDPEVELDLIHKAVLKNKLPQMIFALVVFAVTIICLLFFDTIFKAYVATTCVLNVFSVYVVLDFCRYLRWRKKSLAVAATGKFSRTDISDKLISGSAIAVTLLCDVIVIVKLVLTNDWESLQEMATFAVIAVLYGFFDKLKKKTKSERKKRIITFISILAYIAIIVFSVLAFEYFLADLY